MSTNQRMMNSLSRTIWIFKYRNLHIRKKILQEILEKNTSAEVFTEGSAAGLPDGIFSNQKS
jgi:hypothetical protein